MKLLPYIAYQAFLHRFKVESAPSEASPSPCLSQILLAIQGEGVVQQKAGLDAEAAVHTARKTSPTSYNVRSRKLLRFLPVPGLVEVLMLQTLLLIILCGISS